MGLKDRCREYPNFTNPGRGARRFRQSSDFVTAKY